MIYAPQKNQLRLGGIGPAPAPLAKIEPAAMTKDDDVGQIDHGNLPGLSTQCSAVEEGDQRDTQHIRLKAIMDLASLV